MGKAIEGAAPIKTAVLIMSPAPGVKKESGAKSGLYALSEPIMGFIPIVEHRYVTVMSATAEEMGADHGETVIFGCKEDGHGIIPVPLEGSLMGEANIEKALNELGFTVLAAPLGKGDSA